MRITGCGIRTVLPVSSTTSRKLCAGASFCTADIGAGGEVCAHALGTATITANTASNAGDTITAKFISLKRLMCCNSLSSFAKVSNQKKCPARNRGTSPALLLAKSDAASAASEGSLAYGFSADYSGGGAGGFLRLSPCPFLHN